MISKQDLEQELKKAMRDQDKTRISVLRLLLSSLHNQEIAQKGELTADQMVAVIRKEIKNRHEAADIYHQAGREDLASQEESELAILINFIPQGLTEEQIRQIVQEVIKDGVATNFGAIMSQVMAKVKGQADGSVAAKIVQEELVK
jgi:hypothetical protein